MGNGTCLLHIPSAAQYKPKVVCSSMSRGIKAIIVRSSCEASSA